ncbi:MAG: tRNA (N(6)-L-threonylcarbamoyladenosine(37)-C(2))-methylthiotransferase MtaB [Acidobacteria bacterium]|nr:tRNA (N(6)-L-threonylcarbamoyladenosine(37)-C(2))-methylthiotransferase MtaB [Acidobacteriota bacterium]
MKSSQQRFSVLTLGCKVNQSESAGISDQLQNKGFLYTEEVESADLIIINTCTVTRKADYKARQLIRKTRTQNKTAKIIITGCYAERDADELINLPEVNNVYKNDIKPQFFDAIHRDYPEIDGTRQTGNDTLEKFFGRTRPFIKIQDGCNQFCAYCIVPYVRGASRSRDVDSIVHELELIESLDYKEIILTGIHIGKWGNDLEGNPSLLSLLKILSASTNLRIRLSSLEPQEINEELIDFVMQSNSLMPHFHIPLQSGSDRILGLMGRPYKQEYFYNIINLIRKNDPSFSIGTDVIVGFPSENTEDFNETKHLLESLEFSYMHIFPYSKRPGTRSAEMKPEVDSSTITGRAKELRDLAASQKAEFLKKQVGTVRQALTLRAQKNGIQAITDNYIQVIINSSTPLNTLVNVRITSYKNGITFAEKII